MDVLGIDVESSLIQRWASWQAPACQPFFLTSGEVMDLGLTPDHRGRDGLPAELRDTYEVWNVPKGLEVVWLDEPVFQAQSHSVRSALVRAQARHGRGAVPLVSDWIDVVDVRVLRAQADGDRFVWWPTLVEPHAEVVLERVVRVDHLPCRRRSVPEDVWGAAVSALPHARALSGTFANGSGANCFGTVMAAAGVLDIAETWVRQDLFEAWLAANCSAGGSDERPGTVLVWRGAEGISQHAAVAIGGGWGLHKPSQVWASPRQVLTVNDLIHAAPVGVTLKRYFLRGAAAGTDLVAAD